MRKLFWCVPVAMGAAFLVQRNQSQGTVEIDRTSPQPIGITAALLHDARYLDARRPDSDNLPLPPNGRGLLVAVGRASDAETVGAQWFVPAETLLRSTPLSYSASHLEIEPLALWQRRREFH